MINPVAIVHEGGRERFAGGLTLIMKACTCATVALTTIIVFTCKDLVGMLTSRVLTREKFIISLLLKIIKLIKACFLLVKV